MSTKIHRWCAFIFFMGILSFFNDVPQAMAIGEHIYISQDGAGSDTGDDCANAHSRDWLHNRYTNNWGEGDDLVGIGDTIHLCGTLEYIEPQGSGAAGNPITIFFEPNAKISQPYFASGFVMGIKIEQESYFVIDGGQNGLIETTDNGELLGHKDESKGVYIFDGTDIEIKNLNISNMYQRAPNSTEINNPWGTGVTIVYQSVPASNILVHDCDIDDSFYGISLTASGASVDLNNIRFYNNTFSHTSVSITAGVGAGATVSDYLIYGNHIYDSYWWENSGYRIYGIITEVTSGGVPDTIQGYKVYNNRIGPNMGATAWSLLRIVNWDSCGVEQPLLYNNKIDNEGPTTHSIMLYNQKDAVVANNTIYSAEPAGAGIGVYLYEAGSLGTATGTVIYNNVINNITTPIKIFGEVMLGDSNQNSFYPTAGMTFDDNGSLMTYAQWQAQSHDLNSIDEDPSLDSQYRQDSASDPVVDAGRSMSTYFLTDYEGTARPQGAAWDIGAYEVDLGASDPTPPVSPVGLTVQ